MQLQRGEGDEFVWTCREPPWRMDRIELWWNSANEYRFRLRSPIGDHSEWLTREEPAIKGSLEGVKFKMEFVRNHVDNGDSRVTLELGSRFIDRPTKQAWALEVEAVAVIGEDDTLHAWIERRNAPPSEFVGTNTTERMTLSIPGTASSVITVAAIDAARPIMVGKFSSHGPTRDGRRKPDICAPGVNVIAARAGTLDGTRPMDGTSMAAPHVAGAIALALSKRRGAGQDWPSATLIGALLRQNTLNLTGKWTPGQGYGVIDVGAFLRAF
jgi:endonuclease G